MLVGHPGRWRGSARCQVHEDTALVEAVDNAGQPLKVVVAFAWLQAGPGEDTQADEVHLRLRHEGKVLVEGGALPADGGGGGNGGGRVGGRRGVGLVNRSGGSFREGGPVACAQLTVRGCSRRCRPAARRSTRRAAAESAPEGSVLDGEAVLCETARVEAGEAGTEVMLPAYPPVEVASLEETIRLRTLMPGKRAFRGTKRGQSACLPISHAPSRMSKVSPHGVLTPAPLETRTLEGMSVLPFVSDTFDPLRWREVEGFTLSDITYHRGISRGEELTGAPQGQTCPSCASPLTAPTSATPSGP